MATNLLPDGRPPTRDDLLRAAQVCPIVQICLMMAERGALTMEQALGAAVLALADQNARLIEQLVEQAFRGRTMYLPPRSHWPGDLEER